MTKKEQIFRLFLSCACLLLALAVAPAYAQDPNNGHPTHDLNRTHVSVGSLNESIYRSNSGFYVEDFAPQDINKEHVTVGNMNKSDRTSTTNEDIYYPYVRERVELQIFPAEPVDVDVPEQQ